MVYYLSGAPEPDLVLPQFLVDSRVQPPTGYTYERNFPQRLPEFQKEVDELKAEFGIPAGGGLMLPQSSTQGHVMIYANLSQAAIAAAEKRFDPHQLTIIIDLSVKRPA